MSTDSDIQAGRDLRRQMREGRTPLIEAVCAKWEHFLLLNKGAVRKADELRDQVGSMNNQFAERQTAS